MPHHNLATFAAVLPLAMAVGHNYHVDYCYRDHSAPRVMPFFLATRSQVALLSQDCGSAVLIDSPAAAAHYKEEAASIYAAKPLLETVDSLAGFLYTHMEALEKRHQVFAIESIPCIYSHASKEDIDSALRQGVPQREFLLDEIYRYCTLINRCERRYYFSADALRQFAQDGILPILPVDFIAPFSIPLRIALLRAFYKDISSSPHFFARCLMPQKLLIPTSIALDIFEGERFFVNGFFGSVLKTCTIYEPTIVEAFVDYMESLTETNCLCSKEETLAVVASCLALCGASVD